MSPVAKGTSRRSRVVTSMVVVGVLAFVALTLRVFIYPDLNPPQRSDAIVVLGGNGAGPFDEGVQLARRHIAPTLVFSLIPSVHCEPSLVHLPAEHIVCFRANPLTTQGEGRAIAHLAALHHWHRVTVVMPTTQASRARLRIGRCYSGTGARGRGAHRQVSGPGSAGSSTSGLPW